MPLYEATVGQKVVCINMAKDDELSEKLALNVLALKVAEILYGKNQGKVDPWHFPVSVTKR